MVGFDEERLIDPGVVQVMSGCCQQAQEDITGSEGLGKLQRQHTHTHSLKTHEGIVKSCEGFLQSDTLGSFR